MNAVKLCLFAEGKLLTISLYIHVGVCIYSMYVCMCGDHVKNTVSQEGE